MPLTSDELLEIAPACLRVAEIQSPHAVRLITPQVNRLLGYTPQQVLSEAAFWTDRLHPADRAQVLAAWADLAAGNDVVLHYRLRNAVGRYTWLRDRVRRVRLSEGGDEVLLGVLEDEPERQVSAGHAQPQVEAELRRSHAYYQALLEALPDALLVVDAEGTILRFRPGEDCPLAHWEPPLERRHIGEILPPSQIGSALQQIAAALAGQRGGVFEFQAARGEREYHFEARLAALNANEVLTIVRNTTAERQRARQLQQVQEELAHVLRLSTLGEMAAGLAHELNQPLTSMSSFARACIHRLRQHPMQIEKAVQLAEQVCQQAAHAGEVVRRLRRFVARREPHLSSVCLNELVQEALGLIQAEVRESGVEVCLELEPGLPLVMADRIQIIQVVLNLLRNAVDALAAVPLECRRLYVQTRFAAPSSVELIIADSGPGLSKEIADHLFEPFHTTKPEGLGLGLAISKSIIQAHHGRIWNAVRPGGGTEFHVSLPLTP